MAFGLLHEYRVLCLSPRIDGCAIRHMIGLVGPLQSATWLWRKAITMLWMSLESKADCSDAGLDIEVSIHGI